MINHDTARRMAIQFFRELHLHYYAEKLEVERYCIASLFRMLIEEQGKPKIYKLYCYLPEKLRRYVLRRVVHPGLTSKLREIDQKYSHVWYSRRPERLKGFQAYMQELQEAVLKFLVS